LQPSHSLNHRFEQIRRGAPSTALSQIFLGNMVKTFLNGRVELSGANALHVLRSPSEQQLQSQLADAWIGRTQH
jgi:hypothetical protein